MTSDGLSVKLQALADPTRRAMLARLRNGEATVNELAAPFAMSLPAVSKHIKVLELAGLITRSRSAQQRPCKLSPEALKEVDDWMHAYRAIWEQRRDRLATHSETIKA
jgi:DNA-binding transcriptional ArsR family regulator